MSGFPLLAHAQPGDIVAWRHGQAVTARQFLADVRRLAAALPAAGHMLNACTDRYVFCVGLCAALLTEKLSLLPPTLAAEMVQQVKAFAPDVFCLADHAQSIDMPLFLWSEAPLAPGDTAGEHEIPQLPAGRAAAIVFTSGSTGLPVAHRKSWGALVRSVRAEAQRLGLLDGQRHTIVATVAAQHMYGFESSVLMALQSGAALHASHPFYPADICAALAQSPTPRMLVTTPVHLKALLASGLEVPSTDLVLSATAPLSVQLATEVEARLHAPLMEIYGSTETGQIASRRTTEGAPWLLYPGVTLSASEGRTWAEGGHVELPTPLADEIELLAPERFLLHGRSADLVNIAGKRSSLDYLNHQLNAVPGVDDGAFFMPDEDGGGERVTRLMAFVVAAGLTPAALLAALRERIDAIFLPRPIVFVDALPRNSNGKLPRDRLLALAHAHAHRPRPTMRAESQLQLPPDHPAFAGHFPGSPIVPGVVLLDAVVHAAQQLLQQAGSCEIGSAKFLSPVRPGEMVTIGLDRSGPQHLRFDLAVDGRKIATGTLLMPPAP